MATLTLQQGVSSYNGCIDCHIIEFQKDNNTGANANLFVCQSSAGTDRKNILIKFDLSGQGFTGTETVSSATLDMFVVSQNNGSNTKTVSISAVRQAWIEGTGTGNDGQASNSGEPDYNHYSHSGGSWATAGATNTTSDIYTATSSTVLTGGATNTHFTWDVTADVQAFINGSKTNNGWLLYATSGDGVNGTFQITSSEGATTANRPLLTINYTAGGTTVHLLGLMGVGL